MFKHLNAVTSFPPVLYCLQSKSGQSICDSIAANRNPLGAADKERFNPSDEDTTDDESVWSEFYEEETVRDFVEGFGEVQEYCIYMTLTIDCCCDLVEYGQ